MQQIEYWDSGPDYVKMANGSTYLMILYKDIFCHCMWIHHKKVPTYIQELEMETQKIRQ